jgi:predicted nucleotidyltransferase
VAEPNIKLDPKQIEEFCKKWNIIEFSLFGSVLRDDFGPESDVDVLVTYLPNYKLTLDELLKSEKELSSLIGRRVELIERSSVEMSPNYIRRHHILSTARTFYVA